MKKQMTYKAISLTVSVLVISFAIGFYVFAWTKPLDIPPGENVDAPINIGGDSQTKAGALGVEGVFRAWGGAAGPDDGLTVANGNVGIGTTSPSEKLDVDGYVKGRIGLCIGNDCRTSWPGGTSYSAGEGINISGTTISIKAPTSAAKGGIKARTCPVGEAVIQIDTSGNPVCGGITPSPYTYEITCAGKWDGGTMGEYDCMLRCPLTYAANWVGSTGNNTTYTYWDSHTIYTENRGSYTATADCIEIP